MNTRKKQTDPEEMMPPANTLGIEALSTQPSAASGTPLGLPVEFGRYRLIKRLGAGGMGTVFLAHDTELDRKVALKLPHGNTTSIQNERFRREARLSATLDHPNICRVYDIGQHQGQIFLTMAYIEGNSLHEIIRAKGSVAPRIAANLVRGIASAVHFAHSQGIIHRDLKPANIMVMKNQQFVIMDFGLARRIVQEDDGITATGAILGTPAYMAPEQLRGENIGPQSDVYSLGIILYELLTEERSFQGTLPQIYSQVLTSESVAPAIELGIDLGLCAICRMATASDVSQRYASALELANDLDTYLSGKIEGSSNSILAGSSALNSIVSDSVLSRPRNSRSKRKRRSSSLAYWVTGITALVVPIALAIFFVVDPLSKVEPDGDALRMNPAEIGSDNLSNGTRGLAQSNAKELTVEPPQDSRQGAAKNENLEVASSLANKTLAENAKEPRIPTQFGEGSPKGTSSSSGLLSTPNLAEPTMATSQPPPPSQTADGVEGKQHFDAWSNSMTVARNAVLSTDFQVFRTEIAKAQLLSKSEDQKSKLLTLQQAGYLYETVIDSLKETPVMKTGLKLTSLRQPVPGVPVLEKTDAHSATIRYNGSENQYAWNKLPPKYAMEMSKAGFGMGRTVYVQDRVEVKLGNAELTIAAWAVFHQSFLLNGGWDNQGYKQKATELFKLSVGKGEVRTDLESALKDRYDFTIGN